jgi:hypothetical protein
VTRGFIVANAAPQTVSTSEPTSSSQKPATGFASASMKD